MVHTDYVIDEKARFIVHVVYLVFDHTNRVFVCVHIHGVRVDSWESLIQHRRILIDAWKTVGIL